MASDEKRYKDMEFQRDMSSYLDKASKSSNRFLNLKGLVKEEVNTEGSEIIMIREKNAFELFIDSIKKIFSDSKPQEDDMEGEDVTEEISEPEPVVEVAEENFDDEDKEFEEEKHEGWFVKFISFFKSENADEIHDEEELEEPKIDPDMKIMALFAKEILDKLSSEEKKVLRESGKIDEFKEVLRRNNLIK